MIKMAQTNFTTSLKLFQFNKFIIGIIFRNNEVCCFELRYMSIDKLKDKKIIFLIYLTDNAFF